MRILVIGGTRFIGPRLVRRLSAAGHDVSVAHRGQHRTELPPGVTELLDARLGAPIGDIPTLLTAREWDVVVPMMLIGERDARVLVDAFVGRADRLVVPSSGDVYRAYGIFARFEEGEVVPTPLAESAALRTSRFPYRKPGTTPDSIEYTYDKILVEEAVRSNKDLPATIMRLPKVYGPEDNGDLATVYGFRHAPGWRWTHGHVDNVAKAIALAVLDVRARGRTYNVGEPHTPTMQERLRLLPDRRSPSGDAAAHYRFEQNVEYDTSRIRTELNFVEEIDERTAMSETACSLIAHAAPGGLSRSIVKRPK